MPAAAVIPAPIAYTKVVAVKKLVVGFLCIGCWATLMVWSLHRCTSCWQTRAGINLSVRGDHSFTLRKLKCSKQALA